MAFTLCLSPGVLAPPVRGKFCVELLSKEGKREERFFVADDVGQVLQHIQKLSTTRFKLLISVRLLGVFYYDEFFGIDEIDSFPIAFDIAAFFLQL